jgi:hypothetical protein
MKRLVIAVAAVAALGSSAFSRESPTGAAMQPRHHEVMPYQAHFASLSASQYQTRYPGGHGR